MHKVIRPIRSEDQKKFEALVGSITMGMTSLPRNQELLIEKVKKSQVAFRPEMHHPHSHQYIFVLEDVETGEIEGTCGLKAETGVVEPFYNYTVDPGENPTSLENAPRFLPMLRPIEIRNGPTEICGLFLHASARREHAGPLLSYCRFLYIANHPERFKTTLIAEMRAYFDEKGNNPFWDLVGRKFWDVSYKSALEAVSISHAFVPAILPRFPLYLDLLPKEARDIIGATHPNTVPAVELLKRIGFSMTSHVDFIGVGPKLLAETDEVTAITKSRVEKIAHFAEDLGDDEHTIIANTHYDFRATSAPLQLTKEGVVIEKEIAELLKVKKGEKIRFLL